MKIQMKVKGFATEVKFPPYAHQQEQNRRSVVEEWQSISEVKLIKRPLRWLDIVMLTNKDGMRQI